MEGGRAKRRWEEDDENEHDGHAGECSDANLLWAFFDFYTVRQPLATSAFFHTPPLKVRSVSLLENSIMCPAALQPRPPAPPARMHACTHTSIHTCTHTRIHAHTHTRIHRYKLTGIHARTHARTHARIAQTHTCTNAHLRAITHVLYAG